MGGWGSGGWCVGGGVYGWVGVENEVKDDLNLSRIGFELTFKLFLRGWVGGWWVGGWIIWITL